MAGIAAGLGVIHFMAAQTTIPVDEVDHIGHSILQ
jgi:hypothetical protein